MLQKNVWNVAYSLLYFLIFLSIYFMDNFILWLFQFMFIVEDKAYILTQVNNFESCMHSLYISYDFEAQVCQQLSYHVLNEV